MVRQSRRQVKKRSLRRRTVKGGAYDPANNGPYIRRKSILGLGSTPLYRLTKSINDNQENVFTFDFSVLGRAARASFKLMRNTKIIDLYTQVICDIYPTSCAVPDNREKVVAVITELFKDGIDIATLKKLIITEGNKSLRLEVPRPVAEFEKNDDEKFENFLTKLGDDIMPEVMPK